MITVGELEAYLLEIFPLEDCTEWDNCGLLVGDPAAEISGVCLALDPTPEAIALTEQKGANVLIVHHPILLSPTDHVVYSDNYDQSVIVQAIQSGVALIALHTTLDRSPRVRRVLSQILGLEFTTPLEQRSNGIPGMGQIALRDTPCTLAQFADHVARTFAIIPRVWGDPDMQIQKVALMTGSGSSMIDSAIQADVDLFVAGEIKYHSALESLSRGLPCIDIGHDVSEVPLMGVVQEAVDEILESHVSIAPVVKVKPKKKAKTNSGTHGIPVTLLTDELPQTWWSTIPGGVS